MIQAQNNPSLQIALVHGIVACLQADDYNSAEYLPDTDAARAELARAFARSPGPIAVALGHLLPVADLTAALARTTDEYDIGVLTAAIELASLPRVLSDAQIGELAAPIVVGNYAQ